MNKRCITRKPISLLNVDTKILSKALSVKLKKILPTLISSEQTAYVIPLLRNVVKWIISTKDIFCKSQRYHLASFLKIYGLINTFKIVKEPVHLIKFSDNCINTLSQLYDSNNFFINCDIRKTVINCKKKLTFNGFNL